MKTFTDFPMKQYNTFGIDAIAERLCMLEERDDFRLAALSEELGNSPFFILGGGSNVVFPERYRGTVLHPVNKGIELVGQRDGSYIVEAAAGEVWADFVDHCIAHGWYGVENLAGIPGCVGAAPVQNVGAYGMEAKDVIDAVHCFEIGTGNDCWISNDDCRYAYRWSRFKGEWQGRYLIDRVRFCLNEVFAPDLSYKALSSAVEGIRELDARRLADAVVSIRDSKLPNPKEIGSAGSFFKNPVVGGDKFQRLKERHPEMVAYPVEGGYKLAAGWLIEQSGWKGRTIGRVGVYEKQALVLVNRGGATGRDVKSLAEMIINDVEQRFGVHLEPEAIIIECLNA
ncbi:MAG: UDP-N-acetylmuramate dehydrogenase [Bacteroidales bacterium]|nr:UDP-N-acetylmuramate dehydrogenase [Bacteroidales bacterium]